MEVEYDEIAHETLIKEFRSRLADKVHPDHDDRRLFKWLKARKFDIDAAETMYLKSMKWRQEIGADSILTDFKEPEVMRKFYPGTLFGCARDGSPVWIELMGRGDFRGILSSVTKDDLMKDMVYRLESLYARFRQLSQQHNKPIDKCLHIIDVEGFGVKHLWKPILDMYISILRMLEDNYPETLRVSLVINSPKFFKIGFDFLKRFIDPQTANKIDILGDDYQQTLLSLVDPQQLPAAYGGTRVDDNGDSMCVQWICCGGDVPKYYYLGRQNTLFPDGKPLTKETLGQRRTLAVNVDITQSNTQLRWLFHVDGGIDFSVKRRYHDDASTPTFKQEQETVRPSSRIDCNVTGVQDGSINCDVIGQYSLELFNPNFIFARNLTYCLEVVEPRPPSTSDDDDEEEEEAAGAGGHKNISDGKHHIVISEEKF